MTAPPAVIRCERRGRAAYIALNRPQALNAITLAMIDALDSSLAKITADDTLCAVVITGSPRAFSAGADLKELKTADDVALASGPGSFPNRLTNTLRRLEECPVPVIAAVRGWAMAGGLEIVLCCNLVIAGESARFGDAHANYGLLPGGGSSVRLPRKIGPMRAREMMFTGDWFSAAAMKEAGLVTRVVPDAEVEAEAEQLAARLASRGPAGLRRMKSLLLRATECGKDEALAAEQHEWALHAGSSDLREGLAAFREKRTPHFTGR